jgi:phospholipid/cholesterol/gamma-HCH transport system substrate-binding protein
VSALGIVVLAIAYIVFGGGGGADYHLIFGEAGQLVRGDQVQVGGVPVGSVTNIQLTPDYKARVTIHVDSSLAPLHAGTTAQVRVPSLSSVANRYVQLSPGPNNAAKLPNGTTLPASATKEVVDLDQLFNTLNPRTRKGLQEFIVGSAEQYAGAGRSLSESIEYFSPFLGSSSHFFQQLSRDQLVLTKFLVETGKAVTTIGARSEQLSDLVENSNTTFKAIGDQQQQLAAGIKLLPKTLRHGNEAFEELPSTLAALTELVEVSRPATKPLYELFGKLHRLVNVGTVPVRNFHSALSKPGPNNDLTELANSLPELAKVLTSASPASVQALKESVPITAFWGPYSPDLAGTLRAFGQTGSYYEANGHYARVGLGLPNFHLGEGEQLTPASASQAFESLRTGQLRRCPGGAVTPAADGSSPFTDGQLLTCDPLQTP